MMKRCMNKLISIDGNTYMGLRMSTDKVCHKSQSATSLHSQHICRKAQKSGDENEAEQHRTGMDESGSLAGREGRTEGSIP